MKKIFILSTLFLAACAAPTEDTAVTGHQALQAINLENAADTPNTATDAEPVLSQVPETNNEIKTFANQQEFVQLMFDELSNLEGTLIMLDANLTEALSSDNPDSLLALRDFMIAGVREDQAHLESLLPYNEAVVDLQNYVTMAFHYSMEQKSAEFEIFSTESLEERSELLALNASNEQSAAYYIALAWQEISNLSNTPIYQK